MSYPAGMTCQELVELVTDYLENALPETQRERFDEHLAVCPGCADYVEQMRLTIRAVGHLEEDSLAPSVRDTLLNVFRDWKASR